MSKTGGITPTMAKQLADQIRAVGKTAKSEEDVRLNVELALRHHLAQLGIQTQPSYEQPVTTLKGTGSTDAVYGFGIIEYKRPGIIGTPHGRKELIEQLSGYLVGKAREEAPTRPHEAVKKMIGIGLDGEQVMYLRYSSSPNRARFFQPVSLETQLEFFRQKGLKGGFQVVGPMPIDEASVDWLLYSLQFFQRRALEPHALAEVFGPKGNLASNAINAFYKKLLAGDNRRVEMFFAQWDMIFGVIYGQELERGDAAAKELAELYGITAKPDLKRLLFAVHTYYVLLMKMLAAELISLQEGSWFASFTAEVESATEAELKTKIKHLEDGGLFKQFNIVNFLEGDFFRWYLDVWETGIAQNFRHMAIALQQFEPATATIDPDASRDLLKKLYQYLLPRPVRHALGEYYTPETDLIYPLLRGRDVGKWSANDSCHIILAQDPVKRIGIDEEWMKQNLSKTFGYLKDFEHDLRTKRQSGVVRDLMKRGAFYSMFAIGEYTLAPFKVCWREQAEFFTASVAGNSEVADKSKVIIPDHKLMFVPLDNETEAHFVCAALNSAPSVLVVKSYGIETQTSTHVLEHVGLPRFDAKNNMHQHLAKLSKQAHAIAAESEPDAKHLDTIETEIDETVAKIWSITPDELSDIKFSLADLS